MSKLIMFASIIVHVHATYCHFYLLDVNGNAKNCLVFVLKRYAVRTARIGWYAVRKGEGDVTLIVLQLSQLLSVGCVRVSKLYTIAHIYVQILKVNACISNVIIINLSKWSIKIESSL